MTLITAIWGVVEPLWAIIQLTFHIGKRNYLKVPREQINSIVSDAFDDYTGYLEEFGLKKNSFAPQNKSVYVSATISRLEYSDDSHKYIDGQIEYYLSQRFSLPTEKNFDRFLINSYLLIRLKRYRKYCFPKERFTVTIFKKKRTIFHYLAISNWRSKTSATLIKEVAEINKPISIWIEDFKFADLWKYALNNEDSSLKMVLDEVLKSGKISQSAILNMASTEKLMIIYKYYEGYGTVRQLQLEDLYDFNKIIKKNTGKNSTISKNRLAQAKQQKQNLLDNWIRVPVGTVLESKGFRHLFSKNDPIYFIPLSILPKNYHGSPKNFIDDVILPEAEQLLNSSRNSKYFAEFSGGLKYVLVTHVVQVNELTILESERSLNSLAPTVGQVLLSTTLDNDGSYINNLFINDVVRNVDFLQFMKPGKTTTYLKNNFESLKIMLFERFNIDVYKPIHLIKLTDQEIESIASDLISINGNVKKHLLVKLITEKVEFYRKLDSELRGLKMNQ